MTFKIVQLLIFGYFLISSFNQVFATLVLQSDQPNVTFSTNDLKFELSGSGRFNACISTPAPTNMMLYADLDGVITISPDILNFATKECIEVTLNGDKNAGHLVVSINETTAPGYNVTAAFCRVEVNVHQYLDVLDDVIGWIYFVAWIISFYPQIWINFRRKSVVGLNLDFVSLNILGFSCYSIYNLGLYYIKEIQIEYLEQHPHGLLPAQKQDIAFALIALASTIITGIQALVYERGGQRVSKPAVGIIGLSLVFLLTISLPLALANIISWLDYLYFFSYVKLAITLIKYIPQAWFNYRRKSTKGWSIGNILLDFTGGTFSMLQMIIDAFNYNDWSSLFGDFTKFALGVISILFDIIFMIQHYALYRNRRPIYETMPEKNSPHADIVRHSISENEANQDDLRHNV
ncbi:hypothetical protein CHUAL_009413 [Chamberlinius hualienensis]